MAAGRPLRASATAKKPAVHRHRGAVARNRHRRERDDLLRRERDAPAAAAGTRRSRPARRHRPHTERPRLRHGLLPQLRRLPHPRDDVRRCLRDSSGTAGDEPCGNGRRRTRVRHSRDEQLLHRPGHTPARRTTAATRRRRRRRRQPCRRHQLGPLAAALRCRPRHHRSGDRAQRTPVHHRRRRAARLSGDDTAETGPLGADVDAASGDTTAEREHSQPAAGGLAVHGRTAEGGRHARAGQRRGIRDRGGARARVSKGKPREGIYGDEHRGRSGADGRARELPRHAAGDRRPGATDRLRQRRRDAPRACGRAAPGNGGPTGNRRGTQTPDAPAPDGDSRALRRGRPHRHRHQPVAWRVAARGASSTPNPARAGHRDGLARRDVCRSCIADCSAALGTRARAARVSRRPGARTESRRPGRTALTPPPPQRVRRRSSDLVAHPHPRRRPVPPGAAPRRQHRTGIRSNLCRRGCARPLACPL